MDSSGGGLPEEERSMIQDFHRHMFREATGSDSSSSSILSCLRRAFSVGDAQQVVEILTTLCQDLAVGRDRDSVFRDPELPLTLVNFLRAPALSAEVQLLASRSILNLWSANPSTIIEAVSAGVVECLCENLQSLQYLDTAETSLRALFRLSQHQDSERILQAGGLAAALQNIDFFPMSTQRIAMQTASNICRDMSHRSVRLVLPSLPLLIASVCRTDDRVAQSACMCLLHTVRAASRAPTIETLETLCPQDKKCNVLECMLKTVSGATSKGATPIVMIALKSLHVIGRASERFARRILKVEIEQNILCRLLMRILSGVVNPSCGWRWRTKKEPLYSSGAHALSSRTVHSDRTMIESLRQVLRVIVSILPAGKEENTGVAQELIGGRTGDDVRLSRRKSRVGKRRSRTSRWNLARGTTPCRNDLDRSRIETSVDDFDADMRSFGSSILPCLFQIYETLVSISSPDESKSEERNEAVSREHRDTSTAFLVVHSIYRILSSVPRNYFENPGATRSGRSTADKDIVARSARFCTSALERGPPRLSFVALWLVRVLLERSRDLFLHRFYREGTDVGVAALAFASRARRNVRRRSKHVRRRSDRRVSGTSSEEIDLEKIPKGFAIMFGIRKTRHVIADLRTRSSRSRIFGADDSDDFNNDRRYMLSSHSREVSDDSTFGVGHMSSRNDRVASDPHSRIRAAVVDFARMLHDEYFAKRRKLGASASFGRTSDRDLSEASRALVSAADITRRGLSLTATKSDTDRRTPEEAALRQSLRMVRDAVCGKCGVTLFELKASGLTQALSRIFLSTPPHLLQNVFADIFFHAVQNSMTRGETESHPVRALLLLLHAALGRSERLSVRRGCFDVKRSKFGDAGTAVADALCHYMSRSVLLKLIPATCLDANTATRRSPGKRGGKDRADDGRTVIVRVSMRSKLNTIGRRVAHKLSFGDRQSKLDSASSRNRYEIKREKRKKRGGGNERKARDNDTHKRRRKNSKVGSRKKGSKKGNAKRTRRRSSHSAAYDATSAACNPDRIESCEESAQFDKVQDKFGLDNRMSLLRSMMDEDRKTRVSLHISRAEFCRASALNRHPPPALDSSMTLFHAMQTCDGVLPRSCDWKRALETDELRDSSVAATLAYSQQQHRELVSSEQVLDNIDARKLMPSRNYTRRNSGVKCRNDIVVSNHLMPPVWLSAADAADVSNVHESDKACSTIEASKYYGMEMSGLLSILRSLRALLFSSSSIEAEKNTFSSGDFINVHLDTLMRHQLEEPLAGVLIPLPCWCDHLMSTCPFLFSVQTRHDFVRSFCSGLARRLLRLRERYERKLANHEAAMSFDPAGRGDNDALRRMTDRKMELWHMVTSIAPLRKYKIIVERDRIFEIALCAIETLACRCSAAAALSPPMIDVEFVGEVGTGTGPVMEFFSLASREFAMRGMGIWRGDAPSSTHTGNVTVTISPSGLFPRPLSGCDGHTEVCRQQSRFRALGSLFALALLDGRQLDLPLSLPFLVAVGCADDESIFWPACIANVNEAVRMLSIVDAAFGASMRALVKMRDAYEEEKKRKKPENVADPIAALELALEVPGYPKYPIRVAQPRDRRHESGIVCCSNLDQYILCVARAMCTEGVATQIRCFREGFARIMPSVGLDHFRARNRNEGSTKTLSFFTAPEMRDLVCGASESNPWTEKDLRESIKCDHGYTLESRAVRWFIRTLATFDIDERRNFLLFATGSPRLPMGGFSALRPPLTVVCKKMTANSGSAHAPLVSDSYLPSASTCAHYVKLPDYSEESILQSKASSRHSRRLAWISNVMNIEVASLFARMSGKYFVGLCKYS